MYIYVSNVYMHRNKYIDVYTYRYTHVSVHIHVRMYVCMYTGMYMLLYICVRMYVCMYIGMYRYMYVQLSMNPLFMSIRHCIYMVITLGIANLASSLDATPSSFFTHTHSRIHIIQVTCTNTHTRIHSHAHTRTSVTFTLYISPHSIHLRMTSSLLSLTYVLLTTQHGVLPSLHSLFT